MERKMNKNALVYTGEIFINSIYIFEITHIMAYVCVYVWSRNSVTDRYVRGTNSQYSSVFVTILDFVYNTKCDQQTYLNN